MKNISSDEYYLLTGNKYAERKKFWMRSMKEWTANGSSGFSIANVNGHVHFDFEIKLRELASQRISRLCKGKKLSIYIYMATVYCILMSKYTDSESISFASPVFKGIAEDDQESYNNLLPVINSINRKLTFKDTLIGVSDAVITAMEHQDYPLNIVWDELGIKSLDEIAETAIVCDTIHKIQSFDDTRLSLI